MGEFYDCGESYFVDGMNSYFFTVTDGVDFRLTVDELRSSFQDLIYCDLDCIRTELCSRRFEFSSSERSEVTAKSLDWDLEDLILSPPKDFVDSILPVVPARHSKSCEIVCSSFGYSEELHVFLCDFLVHSGITFNQGMVSVVECVLSQDRQSAFGTVEEVLYKLNDESVKRSLYFNTLAVLALRNPCLAYSFQ